jgi:hypothetical protein
VLSSGVDTPTGQPAAPGWESGHEGHAIKIDNEGLIPMITVRDAGGRHITVPHYELCAGYEYRGKGDWVPETDSRVLDYLERELRKGLPVHDSASINSSNAAYLEGIRETLRRNGRLIEE